MAENLTLYTPTVIPDNPLPVQADIPSQVASTPTSSGVANPSTIQNTTFPTQKVAVEVISQTLNTKTKKILQEFQFTPSGAIQVGTYTPGESGDIRISPNGVLARDQSGNTTFALDGDSGDAVFAGEVRTGAIVTGNMIVGDDKIQIDGDNRRMLFYDDNGIPNILIGTLP